MKTFSIAAISGIFISLALFLLMQFMINNKQPALNKTENIHMTEFIRLTREAKQKTQNNKSSASPPPLEKRPAPPTMVTQQIRTSAVSSPRLDIPTLNIPFQTKGFSGAAINKAQINPGNGNIGKISPGNGNIGEISTNVIPLVRIPPRYPMRAANRRIEGWVKVEFTITKKGTVTDPVVIASQPSKIFNRAALKAIRRWKFKAKIINNEAFEQRAVQTLQFKLSK